MTNETIENKIFEMNEDNGVASTDEISAYMKAQAQVVAEVHKEMTAESICNIRGILTAKGTLEAKLKHNFSEDEDFDTCSAIIYSGTNRFKIEMVSAEVSKYLIENPKAEYQHEMRTCYESSKGVELDRNDAIYNEELTKEQFLAHKGWRVLFGGDQKLMETYAKMAYPNPCSPNKGMPFYLREDSKKDDLCSLAIGGWHHSCLDTGDLGRNLYWGIHKSIDEYNREIIRDIIED